VPDERPAPTPGELSSALSALSASRARNAVLEAELVDLRNELRSQIGDAQRLVVLDESTALLAEYAQDNWQLSHRIDEQSKHLRDQDELITNLRTRVRALEASTSWRLTSPLRRAADLRPGGRRG
jgi:hypothetical protein